ncbi:MAG: hypothetical protein U0359_02245 [Byssovorax sp.]
MHNLYDYIGKAVGASALRPSGPTEIEAEVAPPARRVDIRHEPDPERQAERDKLGLLGRIAATPCLIELYSAAPNEDDALACLGKLLAFRQQRRREAERDRGASCPSSFVPPRCWIIAARFPGAALSIFDATPAEGWPPGVFFGTGALVGTTGALQVGIVAAGELPRDRSTLLVRLMAGGPLLREAIIELSALEEEAHERTVAEQILVDLEHVLGSKPSATREEEEFVVTIQGNWADARRLGRAEGRAEGESTGEARALLAALRVRGIAVPEAARARILAERDVDLLERWVERAVVASSLDEVLVELGRVA